MTVEPLLYRRIMICAVFVAATGLFAVALAALADHVVLALRPDQSAVPFQFATHVIARIIAQTSLPLPAAPLWFAVTGVVLLATLGAAVGMLLHCLRLDPRNLVGASLVWAWRTVSAFRSITLAIVAAIAALSTFEKNWPFDAPHAVTLLAMLPLILGIFSWRTASSNNAVRWWAPQRLGWRCAACAIVLCGVFAASIAVDAWIEWNARHDAGAPLWLIIDLAVFAIQTMLVLALAATLILRWNLRDLVRHGRSLLHWDVIAPWFVGAVATTMLVLPAELLLFTVRALVAFMRPQIEAYADAGQVVPYLQTWNVASTVLIAFALASFVVLQLAGWLAQARLVYSTLGHTHTRCKMAACR